MKILAWTLFVLVVANVIIEPFVYGTPRGNYGVVTWIASLIGAALYVPICGRVLGWW